MPRTNKEEKRASGSMYSVVRWSSLVYFLPVSSILIRVDYSCQRRWVIVIITTATTAAAATSTSVVDRIKATVTSFSVAYPFVPSALERRL
jgi:spore maturation protein SpmA